MVSLEVLQSPSLRVLLSSPLSVAGLLSESPQPGMIRGHSGWWILGAVTQKLISPSFSSCYNSFGCHAAKEPLNQIRKEWRTYDQEVSSSSLSSAPMLNGERGIISNLLFVHGRLFSLSPELEETILVPGVEQRVSHWSAASQIYMLFLAWHC